MFDGADEIHPFGFLHELEHIPRCTATKTLVATGFVAHVKRRGLFAMERAEAKKIAAGPLERDIVADDCRNRLRHAHPFYVVISDGHARDTSWQTRRFGPVLVLWRLPFVGKN